MTTYYNDTGKFQSLWDEERLILYIFSNNQLSVENLTNNVKVMLASGDSAHIMFEKIRSNNYEENCTSD